ncbi:MAG TPA: hypothetical protein VK549_03630, partial [Acidimicrobiia bacterium]|nr:hypothetical protein [Acidimicrobiia bacterium]
MASAPLSPGACSLGALSRRAFLRGALGAAGGLVVAGSLADVAWADTSTPDGKTFFPLVLSGDLAASPQPQRMVFALSHSTAKGVVYASGPSVTVRFRKKGGPWSQVQKPAFDRAGLPKGRGVYVSRPVFDSAGVWQVEARAQGQRVPFTIQVAEAPAAVVPGQAAPRDPSPTSTDRLGVDPICTRDPACPLHTQSLSTVIGAGTPVAALFATPARCQSQYCAPVLDEFLDTIKPFGDQIVPVHIEIYKKAT